MDESLIEKQNGNFANTVLGAVPSVVYNEDCVEGLKRFSDNYFDLAIVDPPYGIGMAKGIEVGKWKRKIHTTKDWDDATPTAEYWAELFRVSKNQIVWGGNYFIEYLKNTRCFIFWDKKNGTNFMSDGELAWTSFDTAVRKFKWKWHGFLQQNMANKEDRIHPTQKPVALYDWIFSEYAKEGSKILDTHLGSGSSRISANKAKINFVAFEVDKVFYNKQNKRYADFTAQTRLW